MKRFIVILLAIMALMSFSACKEKVLPDATAEITMEKETYYDNQDVYFIVSGENIQSDGSAWFVIAPEMEYETLDHVKNNQVCLRALTVNNGIYEVALNDFEIAAGKYMVVVGDENTGKILASHSFKVIETKTEKEGWGDAHSEVYWEEKLKGAKIGTFSIVIKESTITYHYDMDATETLAQWIDTELNVDSWTIQKSSIISPDEKYEIESPNVVLSNGKVFDVKLYNGNQFTFDEINDPEKWPDESFFEKVGLPKQLADITEVKSIEYENKEILSTMEGEDVLIITVESEELSYNFFKDALKDTSKYSVIQTTFDEKPCLFVIYETKGSNMHLQIIETDEHCFNIKFVYNPYDV